LDLALGFSQGTSSKLLIKKWPILEICISEKIKNIRPGLSGTGATLPIPSSGIFGN